MADIPSFPEITDLNEENKKNEIQHPDIRNINEDGNTGPGINTETEYIQEQSKSNQSETKFQPKSIMIGLLARTFSTILQPSRDYIEGDYKLEAKTKTKIEKLFVRADNRDARVDDKKKENLKPNVAGEPALSSPDQAKTNSSTSSTTSDKTPRLEFDAESDYNDLKRMLQSAAGLGRAASDRFNKYKYTTKEVNFYPLQIEKEATLDEGRHDYSTTQKNCIQLENLFDESRRQAEFLVEHVKDSSEKEHLINVRANLIAVTGQTGIGKSTFSRKLIKKAWEEKLYNADIIFYRKFSGKKQQTKTDLLTLLTKSVSCTWFSQPERRKAVLEILDKSENVLIVLDEFENALVDPTTTVKAFNLHSKASPDALIKNMINGNCLPKAKKLLISRPYEPLLLSMKEIFTVEIIGLDKAGQRGICKDICGELSEEVLNYVENHTSLSVCCHVPLICISVMECVYQAYRSEMNKDKSLLSNKMSESEMILPVIRNLCSRLETSANAFRTLADIAWYSFSEDRKILTDDDFHKFHLKKEEISTFFVSLWNKIKDDQMTSKRFYFSHSIIRDFFVALKICYFSTSSEIRKYFLNYLLIHKIPGDPMSLENALLFLLTENRSMMVSKFVFGCFNRKTSKHIFEFFSSSYKMQFPNIASLKTLKNLACKVLNESKIKLKCSKFERLVQVCNWMYELREDDVTDEIAQTLSAQLEISGTLLPSDVEGLIYVLRQRKYPLTLDFDISSTFSGNSFKLFLDELSKIELEAPKMISCLIQRKVFGQNWAQTIATFINCIEDFQIEECRFIGCDQAIIEYKEKKLCLKRIEVQALEAKSLSKCSDKLEKILLEACHIGSAKNLMNACKYPKLKMLKLVKVSFDIDWVDQFIEVLDEVADVELIDCTVAKSDVVLEYKMKCLEVLSSKISVESLKEDFFDSCNKVMQLKLNGQAICME